MKRLLLFLMPGMLALGVGIFVGLQKQDPRTETVSTTVPSATLSDISLMDIEGEIQLADQWLGKVVIVNHWASWCPPCIEEIPLLIEFQKSYEDRGVQTIGVAHDTAEAARIFGDQMGIDYPSLVIEEGGSQLMTSQGNTQGSALPFTAFFDREGNLASVKLGLLHLEDLESAVQPLL